MLHGANYRKRERQSVSLILGEETLFPVRRSKMASGYDTPPGGQSSWVDVTRDGGSSTPPVPPSPGRATPVASGQDQDYMRMLREAQREFSARSSHRVSPLSSAMMSVSSTCRNTPSSSPKSPPNSPNVELADFKEFKEQLKLQGVFINREPEHKGVAGDWREEWRSRPNSIPPRAWLAQGNRKVEEKAKERDNRLLLTLIASNAISLGLGVAVGYWLYRRSVSGDLPSFRQ